MKKRFTIFHDDNGVFRDLSADLADFGRDSVIFDYVMAQDDLYFGLYKPFDLVFLEMAVLNTTGAELSLQYYDGSSFVPVEDYRDDSKGLERSGALTWDKPEDWAITNINSKELYFIKIDFDADFDPLTEIQGAGILWSNDQDLKEEYFEIDECLPEGALSFVLKHQAAKKQIIQDIRNQGRRKSSGNSKLDHITEFDFLKSEDELRQASKFLTLSKIFFNIHDDTEGIYRSLAKDYRESFESNFENLLLTLDFDDDGEIDNNEDQRTSTITLRRI